MTKEEKDQGRKGKEKRKEEEKAEGVEEEYDMAKEIKKTITPILAGVVAGLLSFIATGEMRQRDAFGIIILVLLIYIQKFILPKIGVELEGKDWAGIAFLTFSSWYITWTFMLNL